jgi:hypothetical protein
MSTTEQIKICVETSQWEHFYIYNNRFETNLVSRFDNSKTKVEIIPRSKIVKTSTGFVCHSLEQTEPMIYRRASKILFLKEGDKMFYTTRQQYWHEGDVIYRDMSQEENDALEKLTPIQRSLGFDGARFFKLIDIGDGWERTSKIYSEKPEFHFGKVYTDLYNLYYNKYNATLERIEDAIRLIKEYYLDEEYHQEIINAGEK